MLHVKLHLTHRYCFVFFVCVCLKPLAIVRTLKKLLYDFSQSAFILATLKNSISTVCLLTGYRFCRSLTILLYGTLHNPLGDAV